MILKHDEAEPLELSSGPYGDADMESLNGRWISQSAMAPAKKRASGKADKPGASETPFSLFLSPRLAPSLFFKQNPPVMLERRRRWVSEKTDAQKDPRKSKDDSVPIQVRLPPVILPKSVNIYKISRVA